MVEKEEPKVVENVKVFYTESTDFRIVYANGAWGGVSPQRDITADFYVEKFKTPEETTLEIGKGGKILKEDDKGVSKIVVREKQVCIVMRPDVARKVGEWLIEKAAKIKPI